MVTQEKRREATRQAIMLAAQELFGAHGYANITVDQIADEAGVAKGAIYHHFPAKSDIFEAVLQKVAKEILAGVQTTLGQHSDIFSAMVAGNRAFFSVCAKPEHTQIFLKDGPSVLGWRRWREIDAAYFGAMVKNALSVSMEMGIIAKRPLEPLVGLILGAVTEAAIACADSDNFTEAADSYLDGLEAILNGLRAHHSGDAD